MKKLIILTFLLIVNFMAIASVFEIGPAKTYTKPSQVINLVKNGDTILIQAGIYKADVGVWTKDDLVIKGIGGYAHLQADGAYAQGKAIWVIQGNDISVENIEFSDCKVPDHNGAGIRQEGKNLKVSHCYFHDNENGILAGDNPNSEIIIEFSEFNNNGYGDGYTHNLYINHIQRLVFKFNYSHHCNEGHNLKSRAYSNEILYNFFSDSMDGHSSMLIDLPNGGFSVVMGNILFQGPNATNKNMLTYGLEGLTNPSQTLMAVNNTFINKRPTGAFIVLGAGSQGFAANNIFAGIGDTFIGQFTGYTNIAYPNIQDAGFVNAQNFDFHLLSSSTATNHGTDFSHISSYNLDPYHAYLHPKDSISRTKVGIIDIGAYEFSHSIGIQESSLMPSVVFFQGSKILKVIGFPLETYSVKIIDINGKVLINKKFTGENQQEIALSNLKSGTYIIHILSNTNQSSHKIIIN